MLSGCFRWFSGFGRVVLRFVVSAGQDRFSRIYSVVSRIGRPHKTVFLIMGTPTLQVPIGSPIQFIFNFSFAFDSPIGGNKATGLGSSFSTDDCRS